jgi:hypothetical protein
LLLGSFLLLVGAIMVRYRTRLPEGTAEVGWSRDELFVMVSVGRKFVRFYRWLVWVFCLFAGFLPAQSPVTENRTLKTFFKSP